MRHHHPGEPINGKAGPATIDGKAGPRPAFDASELELLAEVVDGFLTLVDTAACIGAEPTLTPATLALVGTLAGRLRAQADAQLAAEHPGEDPDLDAAVNAAGEDLAATHGRCAVLRLSATHHLVCGMLDDHEMEWTSVRRVGPGTIVTERATADDILAARDRLQALSGVDA